MNECKKLPLVKPCWLNNVPYKFPPFLHHGPNVNNGYLLEDLPFLYARNMQRAYYIYLSLTLYLFMFHCPWDFLDRVEQYLLLNPQFLDAYISRNVEQETLESWLLDRHKMAQRRKSSLSRWKFGSQTSAKKNMLEELTKSLQRGSQEESVLWELAECIASAVWADGFSLYLADRSRSSLRQTSFSRYHTYSHNFLSYS